MRANYYRDKFFHEISELYTYFYHHQDKTILDSFSASEEERKRLRDMRHPIAHVDGDINKIFKAQEDFLKNLPSNTNQINDLILIIRHTRFLLRFIQGEHHLIERLKAILRIYPQGLISPGIQKEILE